MKAIILSLLLVASASVTQAQQKNKQQKQNKKTQPESSITPATGAGIGAGNTENAKAGNTTASTPSTNKTANTTSPAKQKLLGEENAADSSRVNETNTKPPAESVHGASTSSSGSPAVATDENLDGTNTKQRATYNMAGSPIQVHPKLKTEDQRESGNNKLTDQSSDKKDTDRSDSKKVKGKKKG